MLKSYLLVALRSLRKQKLFSIINLLGMAVGMAFFALFALMAGTKLNADRFHRNSDRLYCLVQVKADENLNEQHTTFVPGPLAQALQENFPEIEAVTRVLPAGQVTLRHGDEAFYETRALYVDPNFFRIFSFPLIQGDPDTVLARPDSLVISERAAAKYFGDQEPLGQVMTLSGRMSLTVRGVIGNIPRTSSLGFEFLISHEAARTKSPDIDSWELQRHTAFVLVGRGFSPKAFEEKLPEFVGRHYSDSPEAPRRLYVKLFQDFRLHSRHISSMLGSTHPASVYITFALGFLLLFVVSINFINLSTARYMRRAQEIGMRKVIGAGRRQLIFQFMGESLLLALLALPAAVLFYEMLHPVFYAYMGDFSLIAYTSGLSNSIWNYPFLLKYLVAAAVISGLFSGLYPALVLSSLQPLSVLSGKMTGRRTKKRGSKVLIVFQFTLAVLFIAAASIIQNQSGRFLRADLGFSRERIAVVSLSPETRPKLELLQTKVANHASVEQVTASNQLPIVWEDLRPVRPSEVPEEEALPMHVYGVDYGFLEALEIPLAQGRDLSRSFADRDSFIISETAARKLEWENPIGRELTVDQKTGTVVGVVEDFLFADIGFSIPPSVLYLESEALNVLLVKYNSGGSFLELQTHIKAQWLSIFPDLPFECQTLSDTFNRVFRLIGKLAGFLTGIGIVAVVFACLGILGLASYMVEQRTKEIGIRKVLGAPVARILWRLMREYLVLVFVADVLALGLLYFVWHKVLQTGLLFVTDIGAGTYAYALSVSLAAAALAVMSKTWKAVHANPAESLRYE
jgi:putative ABC transport system permease protein